MFGCWSLVVNLQKINYIYAWYQQQQQQLPLLSHGCLQQQQTKYYRKIHMWGLRGKDRQCPIGTVSVCLKKNNVGKLIVYDSDVENDGAKHVGGLLVVVTFVMYLLPG